jgi:membrane fusion protein, multidrug efflux system
VPCHREASDTTCTGSDATSIHAPSVDNRVPDRELLTHETHAIRVARRLLPDAAIRPSMKPPDGAAPGLPIPARSATPRLVRRLGACLIVTALAAPVTACERRAQATNEGPTVDAYPVASPTVSDTVVQREYVAEVRAVRYAEIRARMNGIIEKVAVDEGQHVEAGQHLFSIGARHLKHDWAAARAASAAAEADLRVAQLDEDNNQLLFDKNVVSAAPLGKAKARAQALEAKLAELEAGARRAKVRMSYARVEAPFSGTINRIPNKVGSAVGEEELLTTIADTNQVYAYFRLSERDYLQQKSALEVGERTVRLKLADGSVLAEPGVVDAVANEFDPETGTLALRARFENESDMVKHGSSAKIVLETTISDAILVPQASTFEIQGDLFVYAVDENNVVHARKIVPKARLDHHFVVESGLTADEQFVLEGAQRLRDGDEIEIASSGSAADGA